MNTLIHQWHTSATKKKVHTEFNYIDQPQNIHIVVLYGCLLVAA